VRRTRSSVRFHTPCAGSDYRDAFNSYQDLGVPRVNFELHTLTSETLGIDSTPIGNNSKQRSGRANADEIRVLNWIIASVNGSTALALVSRGVPHAIATDDQNDHLSSPNHVLSLSKIC